MAKKDDAMAKCMHEWKQKHPKGRGKNVRNPHEQAVAACLSKTGQSKKTNEGMTFKEFFIIIKES